MTIVVAKAIGGLSYSCLLLLPLIINLVEEEVVRLVSELRLQSQVHRVLAAVNDEVIWGIQRNLAQVTLDGLLRH